MTSRQTADMDSIDSHDDDDDTVKSGGDCTAVYYVCLCLVLLGGVVLLLATSEGPIGLHSLFVLAGLALGYSMVNLKNSTEKTAF